MMEALAGLFLLLALAHWIVGAITVACVAGARRRHGPGWGLLAVVLSPLVALVALAAMPARGDHDDDDA